MQGYVFPTLSTEMLAVQQVGVPLYSLCQHLVSRIFDLLQTVIVSCPEASGDACYDGSMTSWIAHSTL